MRKLDSCAHRASAGATVDHTAAPGKDVMDSFFQPSLSTNGQYTEAEPGPPNGLTAPRALPKVPISFLRYSHSPPLRLVDTTVRIVAQRESPGPASNSTFTMLPSATCTPVPTAAHATKSWTTPDV